MGFGLVETLLAVGIMSGVMAGVSVVLGAGKTSWSNTDAQIDLQESIRRTIEKVSREVQESGTDKNGVIQVTILDAGGINNSDIIRFSVPIVCEAGTSVMDANGDVANWGAALTWGCTDSSCMDADNSCLTLDYASTEYLIDANDQLVRRVLNAANNPIRTDVFAQNVTDLQVWLNVDLVNPELHQRIVTFSLTVQKDTDENRTITATNSVNIYLRNRGT